MNNFNLTIEYNIENHNFLDIFKSIKSKFSTISKVQIVFKKENNEYITENISLDWLFCIDSHSFYRWLEFKKTQKQKYNVQDYDIILKLILNSHTNR